MQANPYHWSIFVLMGVFALSTVIAFVNEHWREDPRDWHYGLWIGLVLTMIFSGVLLVSLTVG